MSVLLSVEDLSKSFGSRRVLSNVSFTVRLAEVLGLIGPNGAGKTTLFECLAGLMPSRGAVKNGDQLLTEAVRKEVLFYFPDAITPWADQTLKWVLKFFERLYNQPHQKTAALVESLRLESLTLRTRSALGVGTFSADRY